MISFILSALAIGKGFGKQRIIFIVTREGFTKIIDRVMLP